MTRFGIHHGSVTVGHSVPRTGLSKLHGTTILVSDAVERDARGRFAFRRIRRQQEALTFLGE